MRFKFIGAGQVFRPTDSQQFTILSESDSTDVHARRSAAQLSATVLMGRVRRDRGAGRDRRVPPGTGARRDDSRPGGGRRPCARLHRARAGGPRRGKEDLRVRRRLRHRADKARVARPGPRRPCAASPDFRDVETRAADQVLARADAETDVTRKREPLPAPSLRTSASTVRGARSPPTSRSSSTRPRPPPRRTSCPSRCRASRRPWARRRRPPRTGGGPPQQQNRRPSLRWSAAAAGRPSPASAAPAPKAGFDDHERQLGLQGREDSGGAPELQQLEPRGLRRPRVGYRDPSAHQHLQGPGRPGSACSKRARYRRSWGQ